MEKNYVPNRDLNYGPIGTRNIGGPMKDGLSKGDFNRDVTSYWDIAHKMNMSTQFQSDGCSGGNPYQHTRVDRYHSTGSW
jgi:hypothetical protein